jgi:transcription antitermination factor NusG
MSWYAVYTQCNHEKAVDKVLSDKGLTTFFPRILKPSKRRDRKILLRRPLFPNYVFVALDPDQKNWLKVFRTPGVVMICGKPRPRPIPDEDIQTIKIFVSSDRNIYPLPYLKVGSRVQVISGPLAGAIGVLEKEDARRRRLIVSIELMGQSVGAILHDDEVRPY